MPLNVFKRGEIYYVRGTVQVGGKSKSVYRSTKLSDKKKASVYAARLESDTIDELLHGAKNVATFEDAMLLYDKAGGSNRFMAQVSNAFGKKKLAEIAQHDLDREARLAYPAGQPETLNRQFYTPFIAVWNVAARNEWAEHRKWQRPRKAKGTRVVKLKQRSGDRPVAYERAASFVAAMSPAPAMVMTALFYTGMRPIEMFALRAEDIDIDGRWIVVRSSKTGEPRGVPMHEFLVTLFKALATRGGAVFRTPRGGPYGAVITEEEGKGGGGLKSAINGARRRLKRAGTPIHDVSPYTGRHSVSTQLVVNGVHPHVKDQILGHAADDMSRHYTHVPQAALIEAINTLAVPESWRSLPWWQDPLAWTPRLAEGTGKRTDLERKKA